jgi:hypothetical protein
LLRSVMKRHGSQDSGWRFAWVGAAASLFFFYWVFMIIFFLLVLWCTLSDVYDVLIIAKIAVAFFSDCFGWCWLITRYIHISWSFVLVFVVLIVMLPQRLCHTLSVLYTPYYVLTYTIIRIISCYQRPFSVAHHHNQNVATRYGTSSFTLLTASRLRIPTYFHHCANPYKG